MIIKKTTKKIKKDVSTGTYELFSVYRDQEGGPPFLCFKCDTPTPPLLWTLIVIH
jgi:hypothetical protein